MFGRDPLQVGQDLRLVRVGLAPAWIQREGEGVEVRRHVTCGSWISVLAPCPAEAPGPVEDSEVVAALSQPHAHGDPTGSGADHRQPAAYVA